MSGAFASLMDLDSEAGGLPTAALSGISNGTKLRALSRASDEVRSYVRARYDENIRARAEDVEYVPATGSTATGTMTSAITSGSDVLQAYGVMAEVLTTGAIGVATARVSTDSGIRWSSPFVIPNGDVALSIGVTLTFSDATGSGFYDGDIYRAPVAFGALTDKTLAIACYSLLTGRGWDPEGNGGGPLTTRYKAAMDWLKGVKNNEIDPGLTDGTDFEEDGFFFYPSTPGEGDRGWSQVMGRTTVTSGSDGAFWDEV